MREHESEQWAAARERVRTTRLCRTNKATGDTKTRHNDSKGQNGDGRHDNGKGQNGDGRHDDGDERHKDGKGQQGDGQHNDSDGR